VDRKRRIAFLSEHASPAALLGGQDIGGQNVYVDELSRHLAYLGYAVDILTRRDDAAAPDILEWAPGVRVVNLSAGPPEYLLKDQLWLLMPEFLDSCVGFIAREGARYDLIHSNFWMSGWAAMHLRRRLRIPVAHIFHAMGKTKQRHQGAADTSPDGRIAVEIDVVREVDRLIAQCPSERAELVENYDADPRKVTVIPSAVNIARFRPAPRDAAGHKLGLDTRDFVVVYVGRMLPRKGIRNLIRAFARLNEAIGARELAIGESLSVAPRATLLVVGGETPEPDPAATPEIGALQQLAAELGVLDRVRFVGKRQHDELYEFYSAGDVVVTTPWYEPFGLTPLEGMACGRPVIGSAVGGISFTVEHGVTGFLVPPRDPEALARHLLRLFSDPDLCARMGRAARKRVERGFTWRTVAERTAALYQTLLATHKAPLPAAQWRDRRISSGH
jgi:D-inositol-3-phosphate glycosyltransferase